MTTYQLAIESILNGKPITVDGKVCTTVAEYDEACAKRKGTDEYYSFYESGYRKNPADEEKKEPEETKETAINAFQNAQAKFQQLVGIAALVNPYDPQMRELQGLIAHNIKPIEPSTDTEAEFIEPVHEDTPIEKWLKPTSK